MLLELSIRKRISDGVFSQSKIKEFYELIKDENVIHIIYYKGLVKYNLEDYNMKAVYTLTFLYFVFNY